MYFSAHFKAEIGYFDHKFNSSKECNVWLIENIDILK